MFSADSLPNRPDYDALQRRWYSFWEDKKYFHAEPDHRRKPYSIVIPPPNVTGALHLGHALNNTLQDVQIRYHRMLGDNAMWMPGTDHAGIATQAVVERRLLEDEKLTRHDLGREKLVERIWKWKNDYEQRILAQLKRMGCSCDWDRTRFTLDEVCARAVRQTFFDFFQQGLIYRGKRLVNWDTYLQTAVSDDEVFPLAVKGHFWHFRYAVVNPDLNEPEFVTIATTRPETMLGDTAVAVHPEPRTALAKAEADLIEKHAEAPSKEKSDIQKQIDEVRRRQEEMLPHLEKLRDMARAGRKLMLPLVNREIPLVADYWAKPELGSGCVKITPAHDANDYEVWQRHKHIGAINLLNPDGTLNENAGPYKGQNIKTARKNVVADLEALGLMEAIEDREIELPHSDRSKTPIEPYLADQWFVKMKDHDNGRPGLAQLAMDAVINSRVKIVPERYGKTYLDWLGEKRDWPVSRQLWWGHQIPIWTFELRFSADESEMLSSLQNLRELVDIQDDEIFLGANESDGTTNRARHICAKSERAIALLEMIEESVCRRVPPTTFEAAPAHRSTMPHLEEFMRSLPNPEQYTQLNQALSKIFDLCLYFKRDPDVLDTWFSSALWPHSTLGWPEKTEALEYWYPTSVLITSRDIITLWVARMVLTGLNNMHEVPFREVFIHPKILDGDGETMSKSKGNGVDPLDVIEKFGADALRFGLAYLTTEQQDVRMPVQFECPHCQALVDQTKKNRTQSKIDCPTCKKAFSTQWAEKTEDKALARAPVVSDRFEISRNFANKLWNASRFTLLKLSGYSAGVVKDSELTAEDRWILSRLATVTKKVSENIESYRYAEAARELYSFAWDDFCDYYIEMAKVRLDDEAQRPVAQRMLAYVLDQLLRLLHPMMPFITEEIWQLLNQAAPERGLARTEKPAESIMIAAWPKADLARRDEKIEQQMVKFQDVLRAVRDIRARQNIPTKKPLAFGVRTDAATGALLAPLAPYFASLAGANATGFGPDVTPPELSATASLAGIDVYVDLAGLINVEEELSRLEKEGAKLEKVIAGKRSKLANENFARNAPADVVEKERASLAEMEQQLAGVTSAREKLRGMK